MNYKMLYKINPVYLVILSLKNYEITVNKHFPQILSAQIADSI